MHKSSLGTSLNDKPRAIQNSLRVDKKGTFQIVASEQDRVSKQLQEEENADERLLPAVSGEDVLYVEVDSSMVSTRSEEWKEIKLARVFRSGDCLNLNTESV